LAIFNCQFSIAPQLGQYHKPGGFRFSIDNRRSPIENGPVLAKLLEFDRGEDAEVFAQTPAERAVFLLRGADPNSEPYITKTANLRRRLQRLLGAAAEHSKKLNLRDRVSWIEFTPTGSDFESGFLLYKTLRSAFPKTYGDRLRFRFPPLLKLHLGNEYPRASITTRLGKLHGGNLYYGPFPSRAVAETFANDSLDFFKMRRCVDDLHPDPAFPGCIYSEMKMCLAPCFKGCSDSEYHAEVSRVQNYFDSGGQSLLREISLQRDQASTDLAFEEAAAHHARLEKLKPVLGQVPEIVRRIDRLSGLIVQPSAVPESVAFFRFDRGHLTGPINFTIQSPEHTKSQSMEARALQALDQLAAAPSASMIETMEHLAILKRWYYAGSRVGEIFFRDEKDELPLRRVVRGVSRVYRGEKLDAGTPENSESMRPL
jgi:excinuclease ABC subunit C